MNFLNRLIGFGARVQAAGGGGGGGATWEIDESAAACAITYLITDWGGTLATDVDINSYAASGGTFPNPVAITAGWGADTNLFLALFFSADEDSAVTSFISNWTNGVGVVSGGGDGSGCAIGVCERELEIDTTNPFRFTISPSADAWYAYAMVIKPANGDYPATADQVTEQFAAATSFDVTLPEGGSPGDLMIQFFAAYAGGDGGTITPPDGWTVLDTQPFTKALIGIVAKVVT